MNVEPLTAAGLEITGPLKVETVDAWRVRLLEHADTTGSLVLDLRGVLEADTAGIQLLLSGRATAASRGLSFHAQNPSEAIQRAAAAIGISFEHHLASLP